MYEIQAQGAGSTNVGTLWPVIGQSKLHYRESFYNQKKILTSVHMISKVR